MKKRIFAWLLVAVSVVAVSFVATSNGVDLYPCALVCAEANVDVQPSADTLDLPNVASSGCFADGKSLYGGLPLSACDIIDDLGNLVTGAKPTEEGEEVYLGGQALGLTIDGNGVTVIGLNEFFADDGKLCCPALDSGLQINDVILQLNNRKIYGSAKLSDIVLASGGKTLDVVYVRDGKHCTATITPRRDLTCGNYRIGLWTRDSSCGIGTLTYIRKNLTFGCLGHPVADPQGNVVVCKNGGVFDCNISGIEAGRSGAAGELRGTIGYERKLGTIYANNKFGVYGTFDKLPDFTNKAITVADPSEVKPGYANIYCTLDGGTVECFDIEIIKANRQTSPDDRGIVFRVTDKDLLARSGGIVQGMSGSPVVQNGKLVAAVTHVFVNKPDSGYGIYAKWMLQN